jgi:hypothetical protein
MGLAVADYDRDGRPDLFITNYANEPNTLYRNVHGKLFEETDESAGLAEPSIPLSAWGCQFFDADNDSWPDLYVSNGQILPRWLYHLMRLFSKKAENYNIGEKSYRQAQHFFRNRGDGTFDPLPAEGPGRSGEERFPGRGTAAADFDGDGRLDLVLSPLSDPVHVYRNRLEGTGHWIEILPVGSRRLHAAARQVAIEVAGRTLAEEFTIQPSYASGSLPAGSLRARRRGRSRAPHDHMAGRGRDVLRGASG